MKNAKIFKILAAVAIGTATTFAAMPISEPIANAATLQKLSSASIDWTKGKDSNITAKGVGLPKNGSTALARTAAVMDAQRNLLGIIKGVQIDSETLMEDLMIKSDTVKRNIGGVLKGAVIIDEGTNADGSYYVTMSVPLFGETESVAAAVIPEIVKTTKKEPVLKVKPQETKVPPQEVKTIQSTNYTGVVIDAAGLGLEPTFSPVIFDVNGRAIYGVKNIDADFAIKEGMVGYSKDSKEAATNKRVAANPLVVKAVSVKGGAGPNPVNAVVSVEDGDRILLANEKSKMLDKCAVIMVR